MKSAVARHPVTATLLIALAAGSVGAQETRTISGVVTDSARGRIPFVLIDAGPRSRTLTDEGGNFVLRVPRQVTVEINIRRIGFQPWKARLEAGGDTTIDVTMHSISVLLTTQVIRAREQVRKLATFGFYERMQDAHRGALVGEFITPEEIEMRKPQRATQLLDQRRGIQVRRFGSCFVVETCYRVTGTNGCAATIYLDGQRLNRMEDPSASAGSAPAIDELITVTSVSAIEVYPRGSSAPPRYQSLAGTCAVVVIWTR